ncbi:hypothetical protein BGZ63DRAFT_445709 [Mariannaea sp. PMI_226]|nr:hypothetical protein BGZ63DRAFT_445709 [Mariannaea sp. PMI_226]
MRSLILRVNGISTSDVIDLEENLKAIAEQDEVLSKAISAICCRSLVSRSDHLACATVSFTTTLAAQELAIRLGQAGMRDYSYSCDFEGITPLYNGIDADVDIVAVPGLGSHAIGSWKYPNSNTIWLLDFLPRDVPRTRVLVYGYDTQLLDSQSKQSIKDLGLALLEQVKAFRGDDDTSRRPIIFLGHSLGGLLIKEALIRSCKKRNEADADFAESVSGV